MSIQDVIEVIQNDSYVYFIVILGALALLITGIYYAYLVIGLRRFRNVLQGALNEDLPVEGRIVKVEGQVDKMRFVHGVIKQAWNNFNIEYKEKKSEVIPDPYDYFTKDQLVVKAGLRKIVEIIPAIFVSLGILGTFWGITQGISGLDSQSGVEGLQNGINTLLAGMEVAFYSSLAGISASLIYQILDRFFLYSYLIKNFDSLREQLDRTIPVKTDSYLLDNIAKSQEAQLNDMRSFFTDEFIPMLTLGISETVTSSLNPHLEKSNEIMEEVARNTTDAQSDTLNEMAEHFVDSLNEITGDHIKNLGDALHSTVEWQEKVHHEMSYLVEELSSVAEKQSEMAKNTTALSQQMNEYTETLAEYQEKLASSTNDLNSITEQNKEQLEQMRLFAKEINERQTNREEQFEQKVDQMNEAVLRITNLSSTMHELQEETEATMEMLVSATDSMKEHAEGNKKLNESLITQHELSNEWSTKTQELLEDIVHNSEISESIQENLENLHKNIVAEKETLHNMQSEYSTIITNSVQDLSEYWKDNSDILTSNRDQFTQLNESLGHSMDDFADHMHRGVQDTFEQFDKELKNAVGYLDRGVSSIRMVVESMEQDMDSVNGQISRFNQSLETFNTRIEA